MSANNRLPAKRDRRGGRERSDIIVNSAHIVYVEPLPSDLEAVVRELLPAGYTLDVCATRNRQELLQRISAAGFVIAATTKVDEEALVAAPKLKLVQHQGVGYDNIDVDACRARGVRVALTPEGTTIGVAEHTFLLILALYKRLRTAETALRSGQWPVWELRSTSFELAGKTLGLVGYGRIGRAVASRANAFDARVIYFDPFRAQPAAEREAGVTYTELDQLLRTADIVSLHLPLTPQTRHIISDGELALMPPHAILINTARGALVDETSLYRALTIGQIAGAGLDVFEQEPAVAGNPIHSLENVVVTPHILAGTIDAFRSKIHAIFTNIQRVTRGEEPLNAIV